MIKIICKFIYKEFLAAKIVGSVASNHSKGFYRFFSKNMPTWRCVYLPLYLYTPPGRERTNPCISSITKSDDTSP